mmetsp:Transcript_3531/g.13509  ORF Transcript_3531/g.13509 Transcript_3531/m.13509 type:complete len:94 (+) Transcript_3531:405-686(+)
MLSSAARGIFWSHSCSSMRTRNDLGVSTNSQMFANSRAAESEEHSPLVAVDLRLNEHENINSTSCLKNTSYPSPTTGILSMPPHRNHPTCCCT